MIFMLKKYLKKKVIIGSFITLIFLIMIYFSSGVSADTKVTASLGDPDPRIRVCYNIKTGEYVKTYNDSNGSCGDGNGRDTLKWIGDDYAYCVNWRLEYGGPNYELNTTWKSNSKNAIMAGYVIDYINSQGFSKELAYAKTGATLNTLFAKAGDSNSYNFSKNTEFSGYLTRAENYYKTVKLSKNLPSISITASNSNLSYNESSKKYFSGKVTVSGLVKNYGGEEDTVTYNITAKTSSGSDVNICTSSKGTNCKTSITLTDRNTDYSFYLFVEESKVKAGDTIEVKVNGSNASTYFTSILYNNLDYDNMQKLLIKDDFSVSRSGTKSLVFIVPDLNKHQIIAYKVNENGELLVGATLEIYKDDPSKEVNRLATNNGGGNKVTYTSPEVAEGDDDFFNHDYYLIERRAPDGYIYSSVNKFYLKGTGANNGVTCYYNGGSESDEMREVNIEYCNPSNYEYKCKNTNGEIIDLNESSNCQFEVEIEPDNGENNTEGDEIIATGTDDNLTPDGSGSTGGEEPPVNNTTLVTYDTVCYNIKNNEVADVSYCNNKNSYTRVQNANGNIIIKQPNSKNLIRISKKDITGDKEVVGASLKICTKTGYEHDKNNCEVVKTIDNIDMSWISGEEAHSIYGIPVGSYYIVEVTPPNGYINAIIATEFSIDEEGKVRTGNKTITNKEFIDKTGAIVIKNELTKITISKQVMATTKELAGASLSICRTYLDENNNIQVLKDQYSGECIEAILADGTKASWTSTTKPKIIEGLNAGTYYLIENKAPLGYNTAESILFTLKSDGALVDKDGKSLKDNKLIMYDEVIVTVPTGNLSKYIVISIISLVSVLGIGSYYYIKKVKKI